MAVKVFTLIPTPIGYQENGDFRISTDMHLFDDDPIQSGIGNATFDVPASAGPAAFLQGIYNGALARVAELEWTATPTEWDVFLQAPMAVGRLLGLLATGTYPGRSLDSAYQISSTRGALVSYSVDISCTLTLTSGEVGTVYLEVADDSGFTSGVQEVCRAEHGNTGTLSIGLSHTTSVTGQLSGLVPAGKYARLRTDDVDGTPSFAYRAGQEVLI